MVKLQWSGVFIDLSPQNHAVGAGDKEGEMKEVMNLDKIMVTEFNDFLIVCFTLGMPGNTVLFFTPIQNPGQDFIFCFVPVQI